eukprot:Selendium_serpulae@DN5824_c1_g1_i2.p2
MVKGQDQKKQLKKSELVEILRKATTSKDRNKAVRLLKKFEPTPKKDLDDESDPRKFKVKKHENIQAFVCYRCDKVKQTTIKVTWLTSKGIKALCNTCYNNLLTQKELEDSRGEINQYAYGR